MKTSKLIVEKGKVLVYFNVAAKSIVRGILYTIARSLFACLALTVVLISLVWSPLLGCLIVALVIFAITRVEENPILERWCQKIEIQASTTKIWLLKKSEDIHSIIFNLVLFTAYGIAFWMYLNPESSNLDSTLSRLEFILGAGTMLGWAAGVNLGVNYHNHLHCGIFESKSLNRWFGRLWTIPSGWPAYFWKYKHLEVHHKIVCETEDWVQPKRNLDGTYEHLDSYILCHWPWRYANHFWRHYTSSSDIKKKQILLELILFLVPWSIPFILDPLMGIGLWLYPAWVGSAYILGSGMYTQHVGGTKEQKYSHSTTFLSNFFNLVMFNVGYHTEHHVHPNVHWSELPNLHAQMKNELIAGGSHIVAYGSYTAIRILRANDGLKEFMKQHSNYQISEK